MPLVIKSRKTLAQLRREKADKEKSTAHRKHQMLKVPKPKDSPAPKGASMKSLEAGAKKIQAAQKAKDKAEFNRLVEQVRKHFGPKSKQK